MFITFIISLFPYHIVSTYLGIVPKIILLRRSLVKSLVALNQMGTHMVDHCGNVSAVVRKFSTSKQRSGHRSVSVVVDSVILETKKSLTFTQKDKMIALWQKKVNVNPSEEMNTY